MSARFPTIRYQEGTPDCACICLCAVPWTNEDGTEHDYLCEDKVLYYDGNGRWGYVSSDQWYRGTVLGFIGPIERMTQKRRAEQREKEKSDDPFDV